MKLQCSAPGQGYSTCEGKDDGLVPMLARDFVLHCIMYKVAPGEENRHPHEEAGAPSDPNLEPMPHPVGLGGGNRHAH